MDFFGSTAKGSRRRLLPTSTQFKRVMAAVQKPLSVASFTGKAGAPAWKNIPSWYMVATKDQMIPPQAEEFMAKRMSATIGTVSSSHAAMVSHPKEVTDLIISAA